MFFYRTNGTTDFLKTEGKLELPFCIQISETNEDRCVFRQLANAMAMYILAAFIPELYNF